ncbi:hypothetical protein C8Q76DRAFT_803091 [Earliella scabrosa]|nr:hypothetical protein C8Q76DRAFT_803091 [Earliella scabrosa]
MSEHHVEDDALDSLARPRLAGADKPEAWNKLVQRPGGTARSSSTDVGKPEYLETYKKPYAVPFYTRDCTMRDEIVYLSLTDDVRCFLARPRPRVDVINVSAEFGSASSTRRYVSFFSFHLGFLSTGNQQASTGGQQASTWSQQAKDLAEELCYNLTRLALMHGAGEGLNMLAFPLLLDTLCYTLDASEMPVDSRTTAPFDPFRNYPEFNLSDLPADMPPEYKARMRTLLPYVALNPAVDALVYTTRDVCGSLVATVPVQNRPWEWTEYIGENPPGPGEPARDRDRTLDDRPHVRNAAALSLDLFDARVTGDRVIPPLVPPAVSTAQAGAGGGTASLSEDVDMMAEENLRALQDDLYAEGAFRRDWRETRISVEDAISAGAGTGGRSRTDQEDSVPPLPALTGHGHGGVGSGDHHLRASASSRRPSPASSVRSGGTGALGSVRQSPAHPHSRLSVSTTGDVEGHDGTTSASGSTNKRKMSTIAEDDEIEFVEGPIPASARQKREGSKARTAGKTTTSKGRKK